MVKKEDGSINWKIILIGVVIALVSAILGHFQLNKVDKGVYEAEKKGVEKQLTIIDKNQTEIKRQQETNTRLLLRIDAKLEK